jgi:hypothetical protein
MTKKKGGMSDLFPNLSAPTTTAIEEIADEDINSTNYKDKKFTKETNKYIDCGKYESLNVLYENGDSSIYTPNRSKREKREQFNIINIVDILEELGDQIKSLQKGQALLRKDLVKAGVLKAV